MVYCLTMKSAQKQICSEKCNLCPRKCNVDRKQAFGFCKSGDLAVVSKSCLFFGEEPCITGKNGCGAVFFGRCNLGCVFCQNHEISQADLGRAVSSEELASIFKSLEDQGASHLNLITPTHFAKQICSALSIYRPQIPIVWNTSGYESAETLEMLEKWVDVYLTDIKFFDGQLSNMLCGRKDYFEVASAAAKQMAKQKPLVFDENRLLKQGVVVRTLALPLCTNDTLKILCWIKQNLNDNVVVSLMSQYTPTKKFDGRLQFLNRGITEREYDRIGKFFVKNFENGYCQERSSSDIMFIPNWRQ